jgi:hypothetical protein
VADNQGAVETPGEKQAQPEPMTAVQAVDEINALAERILAAGLNPVPLFFGASIRYGRGWLNGALSYVEDGVLKPGKKA